MDQRGLRTGQSRLSIPMTEHDENDPRWWIEMMKALSPANRAIATSQAVPFSRRLPIAKAIQREQRLGDAHVAWIGRDGFALAHTDEERATIDLEDCPLHEWLNGQIDQPYDEGYYMVTPGDPWDFVVINGEAR